MRAYNNPELAFTHARTMLGVDVQSLEISTRLPDTLHEDLSEEFEGDDETPVDAVQGPIRAELTDIDDFDPRKAR